MLSWLSNNAGTIAVALVLIGIICAAAAKVVRDRKKGKGGCGCSCADCAMSGACHRDSGCAHPEH